MVAVIPSRKTRKEPRTYKEPRACDGHLYRERHLVECFIGKIKRYRRVFLRFDKPTSRCLGFLHFTAALIRLR